MTEFGAETLPDLIGAGRFAEWFGSQRAGRSAEVLTLDVEDLDLPNRCARGTPHGRRHRHHRLAGTARLLPRLLQGRKTGPVFVIGRKARVQLPAADLDERGRARLSYQQAEALFTKASGGATLHQLRHSALTRAAEDGTGTPMHEVLLEY